MKAKGGRVLVYFKEKEYTETSSLLDGLEEICTHAVSGRQIGWHCKRYFPSYSVIATASTSTMPSTRSCLSNAEYRKGRYLECGKRPWLPTSHGSSRLTIMACCLSSLKFKDYPPGRESPGTLTLHSGLQLAPNKTNCLTFKFWTAG